MVALRADSSRQTPLYRLEKKLSDLTLNEIIPSIIYKDFDIFARSLTKFQDLNSLFYSSIQKSNYLSHDIAKVIKKSR